MSLCISNPSDFQCLCKTNCGIAKFRDAVFEYYGTVLDGVVSRHSAGDGNNGPSTTEEEELLIEELQKVLAGFIEANPEAWAPIVSAWSLDNLGRMSSKWSSKISGPPST